MKVTVDKMGRIPLPKWLREDLRIEPGDTLELAVEGDQVKLSPGQATATLEKERGVYVLHTGKSLTVKTVRQTVIAVRDRRACWAEKAKPRTT